MKDQGSGQPTDHNFRAEELEKKETEDDQEDDPSRQGELSEFHAPRPFLLPGFSAYSGRTPRRISSPGSWLRPVPPLNGNRSFFGRSFSR